MRKYEIFVLIFVSLSLLLMETGDCEIFAGRAKISIEPFSQGLRVQLGGYGERAGRPAEGVHDTTYAKILTLHDSQNDKYLFLVTMDICHIPWSIVKRTVEKVNLPFLNENNLVIMASHSHAGLEGMSLDERNILNNPHIGIFDPKMLEFVTEQLSKLIKESLKELYPVTFSSTVIEVPGFNRNRRDEKLPTDTSLNIWRFDRDGSPWIIFVNFTAHETIMTPNEMLLSAGYPGIIQRVIEAFYPDSICMFSNGAEGDVAPAGYSGASQWEKMENYGVNLAKIAIDTIKNMTTNTITTFKHDYLWVKLPEKILAPDFFKIAGDEYKVSEEVAKEVANQLFPSEAPMHIIRLNESAIVTFPGEPITAIGLSVKNKLKEKGIKVPIVTALTNDLIGYILTEEEYNKSGYEVTASFYGPHLGRLMMNSAFELIERALN